MPPVITVRLKPDPTEDHGPAGRLRQAYSAQEAGPYLLALTAPASRDRGQDPPRCVNASVCEAGLPAFAEAKAGLKSCATGVATRYRLLLFIGNRAVFV